MHGLVIQVPVRRLALHELRIGQDLQEALRVLQVGHRVLAQDLRLRQAPQTLQEPTRLILSRLEGLPRGATRGVWSLSWNRLKRGALGTWLEKGHWLRLVEVSVAYLRLVNCWHVALDSSSHVLKHLHDGC